jgi:hypothetical protein
LLAEVLLRFLPKGEAAVAAKRDHRRRPRLAFMIRHHLRPAILKVGHDRVAGAEIDAEVGHGYSETITFGRRSTNSGCWLA